MQLDKEREKDEVKQTDLGTIFFFFMQFFSLTGNLFMPSVPHN